MYHYSTPPPAYIASHHGISASTSPSSSPSSLIPSNYSIPARYDKPPIEGSQQHSRNLRNFRRLFLPNTPKRKSSFDIANGIRKARDRRADGEESSDKRPLHRRGRGSRRNDAFWTAYNACDEKDPFDDRECIFSGPDGKVNRPALANLDTGLKVPGGLVISERYARDLGRYDDISQDFTDPGMRSVSGHDICVTGILRDVTFRLKGTSVTFLRDFYVCNIIDDMIDIMAGAQFIRDQFNLLFGKVKTFSSTFATWFSTKKEGKEEKAERERREREQNIKANQREIARLQREQDALLQAAQSKKTPLSCEATKLRGH